MTVRVSPSTRGETITVTVGLSGGTGNQLFQYATARRLAHRNGADLVLDHRSFFRGDHYQAHYSLSALRAEGRLVDRPRYMTRLGRARRKLERLVNRRLPVGLRFVLNEADLAEPRALRTLRLTHDVYLDGGWQLETYFDDIRELLLEELEVVEPPTDDANRRTADEIQACVSAAVHVRRLRGRPNLATSEPPREDPLVHVPAEYYARAIRHLVDDLGVERLFVFADYLPWAAEHVRSRVPVTLVTHNTHARDHLDLWLMKQCRHFVLANSTFGWWAAWLGRSPDKCVIVPKDYLRVDRGLVSAPAEWLRY